MYNIFSLETSYFKRDDNGPQFSTTWNKKYSIGESKNESTF